MLVSKNVENFEGTTGEIYLSTECCVLTVSKCRRFRGGGGVPRPLFPEI